MSQKAVKSIGERCDDREACIRPSQMEYNHRHFSFAVIDGIQETMK